jgi:hypothetical protein
MSELKVDTLTGKTTANDITVTVGATATQSLEQGLAKAWLQLNGSSFGVTDSLNISGATDNGTGDYTASYTNSMNSTVYAIQNFVAGGDDRRSAHSLRDSQVAGSWSLISRSSNPSDSNVKLDEQKIFGTVHGDLA